VHLQRYKNVLEHFATLNHLPFHVLCAYARESYSTRAKIIRTQWQETTNLSFKISSFHLVRCTTVYLEVCRPTRLIPDNSNCTLSHLRRQNGVCCNIFATSANLPFHTFHVLTQVKGHTSWNNVNTIIGTY